MRNKKSYITIWIITTVWGQGWPAPELDGRIFAESDWIVCVSQSASRSLTEYFPDISNKIKVIHNKVSHAAILRQAEEPVELPSDKLAEGHTFVTVGRLVGGKRDMGGIGSLQNIC